MLLQHSSCFASIFFLSYSLISFPYTELTNFHGMAGGSPKRDIKVSIKTQTFSNVLGPTKIVNEIVQPFLQRKYKSSEFDLAKKRKYVRVDNDKEASRKHRKIRGSVQCYCMTPNLSRLILFQQEDIEEEKKEISSGYIYSYYSNCNKLNYLLYNIQRCILYIHL